MPRSGPTLYIFFEELNYPLRSQNIKLKNIWLEIELKIFKIPKII